MSVDHAYEQHLLLAGRYPLSEFVSICRSAPGFAHPEIASRSALIRRWAAAQADSAGLPAVEATTNDVVSIGEEYAGDAQQLTQSAAWAQSYGTVPTQIATVDLNRLYVLQKHVNLARVEEIKVSLGTAPDPRAVWNLAMCPAHRPPVSAQQVSKDTFVFSSVSSDFRMLDTGIVTAAASAITASVGSPSHHCYIAVGQSHNHLNAVRVGPRVVLTNGTHRAYALRSLGVTKVPCVIQTVTNRDEAELAAGKEFHGVFDLYAKHRRPPLLADYFDPRLTHVLPVLRYTRVLRISVRCEQLDIPVARVGST